MKKIVITSILLILLTGCTGGGSWDEIVEQQNKLYPEHGVTVRGLSIWKHPDGYWYDANGNRVVISEAK